MGTDAFTSLYDSIATRKREAKETGPYNGGNGRIDRAVDLIRTMDFPRSGAVLDVGGATGNFGYAVRDLFELRFTMDIASDCQLPAEAKGNIFILGNVDEDGLPFPDESSTGPMIDLIVALDFIEHILDPGKFARECFRVLKPGGMVLINTPNIQFWRHLHSLVVEGVFPHTSGDQEVYHGGHVAFFNLQDMQNIFGAVGFKHHSMYTNGLKADPPPPIWTSISKVSNNQLSYADLVYSCRKS